MDAEKTYKTLVSGLRCFFAENGFHKAVLGMSGGIDSSIVALLACDAIGTDNVHGLMLPSQYSSEHSLTDAVDLCNNLGMEYHVVPINGVFDELRNAMKPVFGDMKADSTEENFQARTRGTLIMGYANKFRAIALNTTNKSERAIGNCTMYGDSIGGIAVIGDIYKTDVYRLVEWVNRDKIRIPRHVIDKKPACELRPVHVDCELKSDYGTLDGILRLYLDEDKCENEIVAQGFDPEIVRRVIYKVQTTRWKRQQLPPALKI